jgi:peptide/nickel transport system ATP-binding protein
MSPLLAVEGLSLSVAGTPVLRRVDLSISTGEVHGLVGESGAGKSMLARAVLGLLPPSSRVAAGRIRFGELDLLTLPGAARRELMGRAIALIPQDPMTALNPGYAIGTQMARFLRLRGGLPRGTAKLRSLELLDHVRIREPRRVAGLYPHELSGGMRQRVLIAMAFALEPKLIVADEPTTALDVTVQREILRLIRDLQRERGCAVLFVTHDLGVVAKLCTRVSVIYAGVIWEHAATAELLERPRHAYTRALLAAMPRWDRPGEQVRPVPATLTASLATAARQLDAPAR